MTKFDPIEVEKSLRGISFPANKQAIIDNARENGAGKDVLDMLGRLPEEDYTSPTEITEALGGE